jgi:hypothetical protein
MIIFLFVEAHLHNSYVYDEIKEINIEEEYHPGFFVGNNL